MKNQKRVFDAWLAVGCAVALVGLISYNMANPSAFTGGGSYNAEKLYYNASYQLMMHLMNFLSGVSSVFVIGIIVSLIKLWLPARYARKVSGAIIATIGSLLVLGGALIPEGLDGFVGMIAILFGIVYWIVSCVLLFSKPHDP